MARRLAEEGAEDRTMVWADKQTGGRGRMERKWDSRPGGLYISLILKPRFPASRLADLSLMTARSTAQAVSAISGVITSVKPPNDVYASKKARGKPGKISGILAEASGSSRGLDWLVLGVGVNVNNAPRAAGAVTLKSLTGKTWKVEAVLQRWLEEFERSYGRFS